MLIQISSSSLFIRLKRTNFKTIIIKQKMQNLYKGVQVMSPAGILEYTYPLFDTFWNNVGFRGAGKLFGTRNENDDLTFFKTLINDTESILYSFIVI